MTKVHQAKSRKAKAKPDLASEPETITLVQSPDGAYHDKPLYKQSSVTPEWQELICEEIANGLSLYEICHQYKAQGIPDYRSIMRLLRKDEFFRQQYTRARMEQQEALAEQTITIAKGFGEYAEMDVQERRLLIDTVKWSAGKLKPKVYGDHINIDVEQTTNVRLQLEKKIDLDSLDTDVLEQLQSSLSYLQIAQKKQDVE